MIVYTYYFTCYYTCYFSPPEIFCVGESIFPVIWSLLGAYRLWAGEGDLLSAKHVPTMKWDLVLHCLIRRNVPCSRHLRSTWGCEDPCLSPDPLRKNKGENVGKNPGCCFKSVKFTKDDCNIYISGLIFAGNIVK